MVVSAALLLLLVAQPVDTAAPSDVAAGQALPPAAAAPGPRGVEPPAADAAQPDGELISLAEPAEPAAPHHLTFEAAVRGYLLHDQRISWTGVESSLGAEAALAPVFQHQWQDWTVRACGEFYLNQPLDRNFLADTPERVAFRRDAEVESFEVSQLFLSAENGPWTLAVGKMETPFGRTWFPLFSNSRFDAPFLRTEAILWRETAGLIRYRPLPLVVDAAFVNGTEDRDNNSSKGFIIRVGLEGERWAIGSSIKRHDGSGSDGQKEYNDHVGLDAMLRLGRFCLSTEVVFDEYGFRQPEFADRDGYGRHSLYGRDAHYRSETPITGVGYYVDLGWQGDVWFFSVNYGEFYPAAIGEPVHDAPNRRGLLRAVYPFTPHLSCYNVVLLENEAALLAAGLAGHGLAFLSGLEYRW